MSSGDSRRPALARRPAPPAHLDLEERYRATFDLAPIGMAHVDLDGRFLRVNARMASMLDYTPEELVTRRFQEITHPDDLAADEALAARLLAGEIASYSLEKRYLRRGGSPFWIKLTGGIVRGEGGVPLFFIAMVEDIDEHVRTAAALATSQRQLAGIIDSALDGIISVDDDLRIVRFNPAAAGMLRCPAAEALGASLERFVPARHHDAHREAMRAFAATGEQARSMAPHRPITALRADGVEIPIEASISRIVSDGAPLCTVIFRDVSERLAAEEALRESERRFGTAFRASPVALVLSTQDDGRIIDVNDRFLELFGRLRAEVLGRTSDELGMWDAPRTRDHLRALLERDKTVRGAEVAIRSAAGEVRWVLLSAEVVRLSGVRCFLTAMIDITDRKLLATQLEHAQRMESVGLLAGGIAHDFNNLLTAIIGYADMIADAAPGDDVRGEAREIQGAAARAAQLTRQLLTFARRQPIHPVVVDLGALIIELGGLLRRLISEDIDLHVDLEGDLAPVWGDGGQIQQVVVNLVVNARDAMPAGGALTIAAANVELGEHDVRAHQDLRAGPHVMLTVRDTGSGMPPEVQAHIFEPFFTTKAPGTGTGLGLSTCYGIVKQHRGAIWIESEVGVGTVVRVCLPRARDVAEPAPPEPEARAPLPGGDETILLVEDEAVVRDFAARVLRSSGYTVHEASDGVEALQVAESLGPGGVDLLLTDVVMPRLGGPATAARLRAATPGLRVLYMSGYTGHAAAQGVIDGGAALLQKPFTPATLALAVRGALDQLVPAESV